MASVLDHIERSPNICGGKARIVGSRIRVQDIVAWHDRLGWSPDEIVSKHPHVSLSGVYAALAYYHDHRAEIDMDLERSKQVIEELQHRFPSKLTSTRSIKE